MKQQTKAIAFAGMMSAACVVVMSLGTLIPVNTYLSPVICMLALELVRLKCGGRTALCAYGVTAALSLLLAPDREAAAVFAVLGYYPAAKPWIDRIPGGLLRGLIKMALFTGGAAAIYWGLARLMGFYDPEMAGWLGGVFLVLWDVVFWSVDWILGRQKILLGRKRNG